MKSHIFIFLESETLSRESRLLNLHKRLSIQSLNLPTIDLCLPYVKFIILLLVGCFTRIGDFTWRVSDCEN